MCSGKATNGFSWFYLINYVSVIFNNKVNVYPVIDLGYYLQKLIGHIRYIYDETLIY